MIRIIDQKRLKELLTYNKLTGIFTWNIYRAGNANIGDIAGTSSGSGYINICLDNKIYRAHKLAWLYEYGVWPEYIDHRNGNGTFNAIKNLRDVKEHLSNMQNKKRYINNKSGCTGVSKTLQGNWKVYINVSNKILNLGTHKLLETAITIRKAAEGWYGYHKEHGARS